MSLRFTFTATALALLCLSALTVQAGVVYDSNVSYWQSGGPAGTIGGSGQVNGGFVVSTNEEYGVELGLRASQRYAGMSNVTVVGDTYYVQAGSDINSNNGAWWNFDWSVNLTGSNFQARDLSYTLTIVENTTRGYYEGTFNLKNGLYLNYSSGAEYFQDSQNLNIAPWDTHSDDNTSGWFDWVNWYYQFTPDALGTYDFALTVTDGDCYEQIIGMTVNVGGTPPDEPVVPEPATIGLMSLGLAGVGALRRRRKIS